MVLWSNHPSIDISKTHLLTPAGSSATAAIQSETFNEMTHK